MTSQRKQAETIIVAHLPRDNQWHRPTAIRDECELLDINERTLQRAKLHLGIEHKRAAVHKAFVLWRWPTCCD